MELCIDFRVPVGSWLCWKSSNICQIFGSNYISLITTCSRISGNSVIHIWPEQQLFWSIFYCWSRRLTRITVSVGKSKHHQWCADSTSFKLHGSEEERRECRLMRCQQNETANAMTFFLLEVGGPETRQESRIWHKMDQVFLYRVWPQAWIFIYQKRLQMVWIRCLQTHDEDIFLGGYWNFN